MLRVDNLIHEIMSAVVTVEPVPGLPGVAEYTPKPNGGITINVVTHEQPRSGYAVSLEGYETKVSANVLGLALRQFIRYYSPTIENYYLGAWVEDDKVCLDITTVVDSLDEALDLARINKQRAIYHLDTNTTHFTADSSA